MPARDLLQPLLRLFDADGLIQHRVAYVDDHLQQLTVLLQFDLTRKIARRHQPPRFMAFLRWYLVGVTIHELRTEANAQRLAGRDPIARNRLDTLQHIRDSFCSGSFAEYFVNKLCDHGCTLCVRRWL